MEIVDLNKKDRQKWLNNRKRLEAIRFNQLSDYEKRKGYGSKIDYILPALTLAFKMSGMYYLGKENAKKIEVKEFDLHFANLPEAFDGYKILHLTDLHLDSLPGIEHAICEHLENLEYNCCFMTGDYRLKLLGKYHDTVLSPLRDIIACLHAEDGIYATLGNHDTYQIVEHLENMGVHVLANESLRLHRGQGSMLLTGIDDPHYYFSHQALEALKTNHKDFKIALVHSPELYREAANHAYDLYLCGHTHAGQICLPTGIPLITHLTKGKKLYKDLWKIDSMQGYTSAGCGVSGIPVRFNSRGEISLFTLRKK